MSLHNALTLLGLVCFPYAEHPVSGVLAGLKDHTEHGPLRFADCAIPMGEHMLESLDWTAWLWVFFHGDFLQITLKTHRKYQLLPPPPAVVGSQLERCRHCFLSIQNKS